MHIPDGVMDPLVIAVGWIVSLVVIAVAVAKINKTIDERTIPFMAILAAGLFVAQMLNFPIGGGTSGHLIGAVLVTALLGPFAAMIILTVIIIIQALLFGDGGVTAMGLNLLNMAIIAPTVGWVILKIGGESFPKGSIFAASWLSVFLAGLAVAFEFSLSYALSGGIYGLAWIVALPTMVASQAIVGIGEAIITGGIILYLAKVAPEMVRNKMPQLVKKAKPLEV